MCQKYKPKLKFSDYITSEYHNRTSAYMTTNDCDILLEKLKDGWSYVPIKNGFWLRCPDISVVDIADPFKVKKNNSIEYFALFNYIRDLKERNLLYKKIDNIIKKNNKLKGLSFYISEGSSLEAEIRIGGSDKRIEEVKKILINKLYLEKDFKSYLKASKLYLNKTRDIPTSIINKNNIDIFCLNLIEKLELLNQSIVSHNMNSNKKEINLNIIKNICTKLPKNDVLIFIPTGCYQYITSFINKQTYNKIMLWEIHNNKDASHSCKYLTKNIKGKKCLIIDKSYTGKTLDMMEKNIIKNNGYPIKLALFPKSMEAIKRSDYIVFLDKIYKSQSIKEEGDWMNKLYKKTLSTS